MSPGLPCCSGTQAFPSGSTSLEGSTIGALCFAPFLKPLTLGKSHHPKGTKAASSSLQRVSRSTLKALRLSQRQAPLSVKPGQRPSPPASPASSTTVKGQLRILNPTPVRTTPGSETPVGVSLRISSPAISRLEVSPGLSRKTVRGQLLLGGIMVDAPPPLCSPGQSQPPTPQPRSFTFNLRHLLPSAALSFPIGAPLLASKLTLLGPIARDGLPAKK